jgi:hypothetical protein
VLLRKTIIYLLNGTRGKHGGQQYDRENEGKDPVRDKALN